MTRDQFIIVAGLLGVAALAPLPASAQSVDVGGISADLGTDDGTTADASVDGTDASPQATG